VPGRVVGLLRLLRVNPAGLERDLAIELLQPRPVRTETGTGTAEELIGAACELGLAAEEPMASSTRLQLAPNLARYAADESVFEHHVPLIIAQAALAATIQNEPNPFARVCAWLLLQNPVRMPQGHGDLKLRASEQGIDPDALGLRSDARWDMVLYWSNYLGLTWQTTDKKCTGIVPDPTRLILRHIDDLIPPGQTVGIREFRSSIGSLCPVLDGGTGNNWASRLIGESDPSLARPDDQLSNSLSFALRYLRSAARLHYWCPDDQRDFLLMTRNEKIAYVSRDGGSA